MQVDNEVFNEVTTQQHDSGVDDFTMCMPYDLSFGSNTISVMATDGNGNTSRQSVEYTFNIGHPTIGPKIMELVGEIQT